MALNILSFLFYTFLLPTGISKIFFLSPDSVQFSFEADGLSDVWMQGHTPTYQDVAAHGRVFGHEY